MFRLVTGQLFSVGISFPRHPPALHRATSGPGFRLSAILATVIIPVASGGFIDPLRSSQGFEIFRRGLYSHASPGGGSRIPYLITLWLFTAVVSSIFPDQTLGTRRFFSVVSPRFLSPFPVGLGHLSGPLSVSPLVWLNIPPYYNFLERLQQLFYTISQRFMEDVGLQPITTRKYFHLFS